MACRTEPQIDNRLRDGFAYMYSSGVGKRIPFTRPNWSRYRKHLSADTTPAFIWAHLPSRERRMISYDVDQDGDHILLLRCEGPFGLPVSQWEMTPADAERVSRILADAAKAMRKRATSINSGNNNG